MVSTGHIRHCFVIFIWLLALVGGVYLSTLVPLRYVRRTPNDPLVKQVASAGVDGDELVLVDGRRVTGLP